MGGWRWPVVQLAAPEHDGWGVVHHLLRGAELPERLCSDAHLAALAIANGWRLVSSDRDGERSEGLELLRLRSIRGGRPSQLPKLLIREPHHGTRHVQGQDPIPFIEQIHRSLIAIRGAVGGGQALQGFERQLAQRGGLEAQQLQGAEQPIAWVRSGS